MSEERDNALAIAALRGEVKAQEERIKSMKAENESALDRTSATLDRFRADMATRETRLILAMIIIVSVSLTIFGFLTTP